MILYIGNNIKSSNTTVLAQLSQLLVTEGFTVTISSSKNNQIIRLLDMLFSVLKWSNKIDYVLIDTYSTKNFYYAFFVSQLCRIMKLKYIPILHGGNLPNRLKTTSNLSKLIFKNSHCNIAPSNYLKEAFEKEGYSVKFIPNNLEIRHYTFKVRTIFSPKLLYVRAFSEIYNPELLIRTLHELKKDYQEASLCMVGPDKDGTLVKCKELVNQLELKGSVIFTGKLGKLEWHQLSKEYDVFVNPTNFDNTPVSVMEAMALGLPIVSTNVGGVPYLINDGVDGILVKPNSILDMVQAVKKCIENPVKTQIMTKYARAKVEGFDWGEVKKDWMSVLS